MRSRNGYSSFLLAVCSIILFSCVSLNANEYFISYRYVVKDATLFNESLLVSEAMKKCSPSPNYKDAKALILLKNDSDNLKKIILDNYEEFIEYIHKLGVEVRHNGLSINSMDKSSTIVTLKTTCFKVDFNENFVKIAPLK